MDHPIYRVVDFDIVEPHTLQVHFNDGTAQTICFQSILEGEMFGVDGVAESDRANADRDSLGCRREHHHPLSLVLASRWSGLGPPRLR